MLSSHERKAKQVSVLVTWCPLRPTPLVLNWWEIGYAMYVFCLWQRVTEWGFVFGCNNVIVLILLYFVIFLQLLHSRSVLSEKQALFVLTLVWIYSPLWLPTFMDEFDSWHSPLLFLLFSCTCVGRSANCRRKMDFNETKCSLWDLQMKFVLYMKGNKSNLSFFLPQMGLNLQSLRISQLLACICSKLSCLKGPVEPSKELKRGLTLLGKALLLSVTVYPEMTRDAQGM